MSFDPETGEVLDDAHLTLDDIQLELRGLIRALREKTNDMAELRRDVVAAEMAWKQAEAQCRLEAKSVAANLGVKAPTIPDLKDLAMSRHGDLWFAWQAKLEERRACGEAAKVMRRSIDALQTLSSNIRAQVR